MGNMEVKLVITATKDEDSLNRLGKKYTFTDEAIITIGRGEPNKVPLIDSGRTVSRNHARLVAVNGGYELEDLDSKNFTFLNGERIEYGQKRPLKNGDTISVGDFSMECFLDDITQELGETIIDPAVFSLDLDRDNPFTDSIAEAFEALKKVCDRYDEANVDSRVDYLSHAIQKVLPAYEGHKALTVFVNSFSDTEILPPTAPPQFDLEPRKELPPTRAGQSNAGGRDLLVLDATLASLKQLIRIPYEFRGEFIGHTMWQDEESTFLYEGDYEVTKQFLLDASSSRSDTMRKLDRLKEAANKVVVHQVGMLEGYRAVVRESLHHILLELDPSSVEEEIYNAGGIHKIIPALGSGQVLQEIKQKFALLQQSDWSANEQRTYRPIFIRAYMAAISEND